MSEIQSYIAQAEQQELFRRKSSVDHAGAVFRFWGSASRNTQKLAQLLTVFDMTMQVLGWDKSIIEIDKNGNKIIKRQAITFSSLIEARQAGIDAKYHDDYVKIAIADEIVRKRRTRFTPEPQFGRNDDTQY